MNNDPPREEALVVDHRRLEIDRIHLFDNIQISNKVKRQLFGVLNFGHCDLFVICFLRFGIFHRNLNVSSSIKLEAAARGSAHMKLHVAGTVNRLNIERPTSNVQY